MNDNTVNINSDTVSSSLFSEELNIIRSDSKNTFSEIISSENDNENSNNLKKDYKEFDIFQLNKEEDNSDYYDNFYN